MITKTVNTLLPPKLLVSALCLGRSYAGHIAAQYGITDQQLQTLLQERNLLDGDE